MENEDFQNKNQNNLKGRSGSFNAFKKKFDKSFEKKNRTTPEFQQQKQETLEIYEFEEDERLVESYEADSYPEINNGGIDNSIVEETGATINTKAQDFIVSYADNEDDDTLSYNPNETVETIQSSRFSMSDDTNISDSNHYYESEQNQSRYTGFENTVSKDNTSNTFEDVYQEQKERDTQNTQSSAFQDVVTDQSVERGFFSFTGRSSRQEYWRQFLVFILVSCVSLAIGGRDANLFNIFLGLFLIPVQVRRFHDINKSGWWLLLQFIPILGLIALLYYLGFKKGTEGPNQYGEDPLQYDEPLTVTNETQHVNNQQSRLQDTTSQVMDNLKERASSAATVAGGTISSILQTVSEKSAEATGIASELVNTVSDKTPEIKNNISDITQKVKEKAVELSSNFSDNKTESADNSDAVTTTSNPGESESKTNENDLANGETVELKEANRTVLNDSFTVSKDKLTGINNKLVIALIVVALLIGGAGSYILFGRSSDDKKSVAQSQPNTTQQTTKPIESVPAPKPVEKPTPPVQQFEVDQKSPRNAFISFHTAITNRQFADAYNILSPGYQNFVRGYDNFARGYATTLRSDIVDLNSIHEDNSSAVLTYKLKAEDQVESGKAIQYYIGKAKLLKINGQWRIDSTEARKASQDSKASVNLATITAKGEVNLRAYPTTNANSVGVVREGDLVEILETGTCSDSAAAIVISDDISFGSGGKYTKLSKGMAIKILRDNGKEIICRVNIDNHPIDVRFAPNHLVKLNGTTWYKISSNGQTGWIYSNYARKK